MKPEDSIVIRPEFVSRCWIGSVSVSYQLHRYRTKNLPWIHSQVLHGNVSWVYSPILWTIGQTFNIYGIKKEPRPDGQRSFQKIRKTLH